MIEVENLYKIFKLYRSPVDRLKEIVLGRKFHRRFTALDGVSFSVKPGRTLGVIGENGAGKTTLLKILTGVLLPDRGRFHIDGKITGLLELGTGFNLEFSGVENIYLNGTLLGMSRKEIDSRRDAIIAFSELGAFIHEPLKRYSSGMAMRLAFSIAIHADPRAFVVDEALSVGDAYFQQKCMEKIKAFKRRGGAIVFVSHDMNAIKVLCDTALLLDKGRVAEQGDPEKVVDTYNLLLARKSKGEEISVQNLNEQGESYGTFQAVFSTVKMLNPSGIETQIFSSGGPCTIAIHLEARAPIDNLTVGILIRDRFGQDIFGTNTYHLRIPIRLKTAERRVLKYFIDELNLGPGKYTLTVAAHGGDTHVRECYQWSDRVKAFEVTACKEFVFIGFSRLKPQVRMELG